jgi:glycosyltransferase involved in cell wall biosynthesis
MTEPADVGVVIPTLGRESLGVLIAALDQEMAFGVDVRIVDDRPDGPPLSVPSTRHIRCQILASGGNGPAAARNVGWRSLRTRWVAFLDDDVLPRPDWFAELINDLRELPLTAAGSQGQVLVPLPADRPPTDWERCTAGLQGAPFITADMAYRLESLRQLDGFDERFRRAFREDVDLALRAMDAGMSVEWGRRIVEHPVRAADRWVSVRAQAGTADDQLMRRLHGRSWRSRGRAPRGRIRQHVASTAAAALAMIGLATRHHKLTTTATAAWLASTAEFTLARLRNGPRTRREITTMLVTSVAIPPWATLHAARGAWIHRTARPLQPRSNQH